MQCARDGGGGAADSIPAPKCGGYQLQVTGGAEMRVKELEVE